MGTGAHPYSKRTETRNITLFFTLVYIVILLFLQNDITSSQEALLLFRQQNLLTADVQTVMVSFKAMLNESKVCSEQTDSEKKRLPGSRQLRHAFRSPFMRSLSGFIKRFGLCQSCCGADMDLSFLKEAPVSFTNDPLVQMSPPISSPPPVMCGAASRCLSRERAMMMTVTVQTAIGMEGNDWCCQEKRKNTKTSSDPDTSLDHCI